MQFDSSLPIWMQLVTEFSRRIVVGQWPAGVRIPGVRGLAADLGVNPNTIQRALSELEREGLCRSERTSGRFVTEDADRIDRLRADLAEEAADVFIEHAHGFGMGRVQAQQLLSERWEHHDHDSNGRPQTEGA
ncbi:GntR family transcriptional regulator [Brachybacterium paraconglomeratum]|uniref:GntR family transcriptional regulator n=1 Tax=Brachybacterium paraconglomeratum TaxID=173362 RepID=UPI0031ED9BDD